MPIAALKLNPGVQTEFTEALNESGVSRSNLIRYEAGLPQKIGGWDRYYPFSFGGTPRDLHAWQDLNADGFLAVGTDEELGVISGGVLTDITPQTLLSDFPEDFTSTNGSAQIGVDDPNISNVTTLDAVFFNTPISVGGVILTGAKQITVITGTTSYEVTADGDATSTDSPGAVPVFDTTSGTSEVLVTFASHALVAGQSRFTFPIPTTGGGVTIEGTYNVITTPTADTFTISADIEASSTATFAMNGGEAQLLYYINLGPAAAGVGYGIGGYGLGGYGTGVVPTSQTGDPIETDDWTSDNWGEVGLFNPRGQGIYYWQPRSGFQNAAFISQGPPFSNGIFVAMPQQILVSWGSTTSVDGQGTLGLGNALDPMLVRWSDIENFFGWIAASGSQAGSYRIPIGSVIRGGIQGPQQALLWTDLGLWAMQYVGYPLIWAFNNIGTGCGAVGAHAMGILNQVVYWMSSQNFFVLGGGGVRELPCTVWDVIFQDLDTANIEKCRAAPNSAFGEIAWHYPSLSGGAGENDKYVMYHASESIAAGRPIWSYGELMPRSAWVDQSVLGQPIGADPNGLIFQHETSYDADGTPLEASFETGWFVVSDGWDLLFIDQFWPDLKYKFWNATTGSASVLVTITTADYPNGATTVSGPFTMTQASTFIGCRCRGRLVKLTFASADIGTWWRLGNMRYRAAKSGKR